MSRNSKVFAELDKSALANQYVLIVDGKLFGSGQDIEAMLKKARKKHAGKLPFVAKVPDDKLLIV